MQVREGNGLEQITAEEAADAAAYERDRERIDDALAQPGTLARSCCSRSARSPPS